MVPEQWLVKVVRNSLKNGKSSGEKRSSSMSMSLAPRYCDRPARAPTERDTDQGGRGRMAALQPAQRGRPPPQFKRTHATRRDWILAERLPAHLRVEHACLRQFHASHPRGAYACLNVRWRFDEKHSLPAAALQMEEEMRTAFQGPELPFVFGYGWRGGCVRDGKARAGSNGVMLTAWRQSWQAGAVT